MYVIKNEFDPVEEKFLAIQQIFLSKRSDPDPDADPTWPKSPGSDRIRSHNTVHMFR